MRQIFDCWRGGLFARYNTKHIFKTQTQKKRMDGRSAYSHSSPPLSPRAYPVGGTFNQTALTPAQVSNLTSTQFREGETVKGIRMRIIDRE